MEFQYRNSHIFPTPFKHNDNRYPPLALLEHMSEGRDFPKGFGKIYISSVRYCKQDGGAHHEFLAFDVEDATSTDRRNTIIIGRVPRRGDNNNPGAPASPQPDDPELQAILDTNPNSPPEVPTPYSRGAMLSAPYDVLSSSKSKLDPHQGLDLCYVSSTRNGAYEAHAKRVFCSPFTCIKSMGFTGKSFTIEKLLVLAGTVSSQRPAYNLIDAQCYWYALSLWKLMECQEIHEDGTHDLTERPDIHPATHLLALGLEARFSGTEHQREIEQLVQKYKTDWDAFVKDLQNRDIIQQDVAPPNGHENDESDSKAPSLNPPKSTS